MSDYSTTSSASILAELSNEQTSNTSNESINNNYKKMISPGSFNSNNLSDTFVKQQQQQHSDSKEKSKTVCNLYVNTNKSDLLMSGENEYYDETSKKAALLLSTSDMNKLNSGKHNETDKKDAITKAFDCLARAASCKNVKKIYLLVIILH